MRSQDQKPVATAVLTLSLLGTAASLGCAPPPPTGGSDGSGGAGSAGGTGGAMSSSGGTPSSSGGVSNAGTGGYVGSGGTGGVSTGSGGLGSGGSPNGSGGAASGGGPANPGEPDPSPGCGMADPTDCLPCMTSGRPYYVDMPENYDPAHPYPVVFKYHPLGGSGQGARNMYLGPADFDAIYVSQDGSDNGFPNSGGADEQMTREIMEDIEARLCIDRARYFATGFSYGGSMSFTAACNMSDRFRAIAAMAGAHISGAGCANEAPERPVAVLGIHGEKDQALSITFAEPIIEAMLEKNGCTEATAPSPLLDDVCVQSESALQAGAYQGCQEGYPVIWCPIPGYDHNIPTWSRGAIAQFFELF